MATLLSGLITSKTRIEILMRLFLNPDRRAHLRELAGELAVSPSQVKSELDNLSDSGLLTSAPEGNRIQFGANPAHPLFPELHAMVRKALGMDRILESILLRLGRLELAILVGDYAMGRDSGCIDLVSVGDIDQRNLADLRQDRAPPGSPDPRPGANRRRLQASCARTFRPTPPGAVEGRVIRRVARKVAGERLGIRAFGVRLDDCNSRTNLDRLLARVDSVANPVEGTVRAFLCDR